MTKLFHFGQTAFVQITVSNLAECALLNRTRSTRTLFGFALILFGICSFGSTPAVGQDAFELSDGARVVWIGSEFTEQETKYNFVEAALTTRWPDRRFTFRNLGWAGDDPSGVARGYFGGATEGYRRLQEELTRLKPTVIFVAYGENSAYAGADEFPKFKSQMKTLIADLKKLTEHIILVTPPPLEKLEVPLPDPEAVNAHRKAICEVIKQLHLEEKLGYIDLFTPLAEELQTLSGQHFTTDTLRFNEAGYAAAAKATLNVMAITDVSPASLSPELRELIRLKNDLYFHQYRPQNETYLRGFRKHEQGQNAKDIAAFEPLIEQAEANIAAFVKGKPLPYKMEDLPPREIDFKPLSPQEQQAKFKLAPGLEITPFASEPLVANPIHMNFDSKGRLWVATSPIYPQIRPGALPSDEIIVLEDTDGDNVADKRTVFADGLLIPTAILPDERGGAFVANSTELLHLIDNDGDGKADERRVLLSGFGTEDTHHILHTFRWSPDALLNFNQSIYIHSHLETPYGVQAMLGSGIWRYRPETARANTVAFGMVNPWGLIYDNWGQSFSTDGAGGEGIYYVFPGAAYQTAVGYDRILQGMNPGQPKFCGLEMITGRHFDDQYQSTLVTADFRGNRVCRFRLSEEASGYVSRQVEDVLTCDDRAFRPVDLKMSPDGSLFIADWHNPIINHGEVDFRDPRRDDRHGRIWRITQTGRTHPPRPEFNEATIDELTKHLEDPEQWTRQMARVHLKQRDRAKVHARVKLWLSTQKSDDPLFEQRRLEALWTYQALGDVPGDLLESVLKSTDHHARSAAVRILSQATVENYGLPVDFPVVPLLKQAVTDVHPQVRLEAVNALRQVADPEAAALALNAQTQPTDKWIDFALWTTVRTKAPEWMAQIKEGTAPFSSNPQILLFVLRSINNANVLPPLMQLLESNEIPADQLPAIFNMIGAFGSPSEARILLNRLGTHPGERAMLLNSLLNMAEKRNVVPTGDLTSLEKHFDTSAGVRLAAYWKLADALPKLTSIATNQTASMELRDAAIRGLATLKAREQLDSLASHSKYRFAIRRRAAAGILNLDGQAGVQAAIQVLMTGTPADEAEAGALVDLLLARKDGPDLLAEKVKDVTFPEAMQTLTTRKASSAGARGEKLLAALKAATPGPTGSKKMTPEEIAGLLAKAQTQGNAARGEQVYRRAELGCMSCHSIGGAGGQAGPDMLSLGASSPVDYILESLLSPSAKIKEGYHTTTIATEDGKIYSGIMVRDGDTEVVIRDAQNKEIAISKAEIDERVNSPTSLMPADLTSKLNQKDLVDLVVFLSSLGKEGPYKVPQNRFVRRWLAEDQKQLLSRVDGTLQMSDSPGGSVSFDINVTTPGRIALKLTHPEGLKVFHQSNELKLTDGQIAVDLSIGHQRFQIQPEAGRVAPITVEVIDLPDSSGRAEPVNR